MCNTTNAHVLLFIYPLIIPLIRTDKPNDWDIAIVQKHKTLSIRTRYNLGKHRLQPYTFKHCQNHIQTAATIIRLTHHNKAILHKVYNSINWRSQKYCSQNIHELTSLLIHLDSFTHLLSSVGLLAWRWFTEHFLKTKHDKHFEMWAKINTSIPDY